MDEIALLRALAPETKSPDPAARAAALKALEARFDSGAGSAQSVPARRRGFSRRHRRLVLAFASAVAIAAAVAGILVLSSGPTAQPAAAEILHKTAGVAAATNAPPERPRPGQFLYQKYKQLQLQSWILGGTVSVGGKMTHAEALRWSDKATVDAKSPVFTALIPTTQQSWTALNGNGRYREVDGPPQFLTREEKRRWQAEGSPLPGQRVGDHPQRVLDVKTYEQKGSRFPVMSRLPTNPEALLRAVRSNHISVPGFHPDYPSAKRLDTKQTIAQLLNLLFLEGNTSTPQLRAAVFNALAELPGIRVETGVTDSLGREGDAIRTVGPEAGGLIDPKTGGGFEFIFDPNTSQMLAKRSFLGEHPRGPSNKGLPAGLTLDETDYLQTGIVDSTHETAARR